MARKATKETNVRVDRARSRHKSSLNLALLLLIQEQLCYARCPFPLFPVQLAFALYAHEVHARRVLFDLPSPSTHLLTFRPLGWELEAKVRKRQSSASGRYRTVLLVMLMIQQHRIVGL